MPTPKNPADANAAQKSAKGDFPKFSLKDAIKVAEALQRNGGQPISALDMATAIGKSPGSSGFRQIGASASAYGLTGGSYRSMFSLRDGGRAIVSPMTPDERPKALVAAALTPKAFRQVYDYYKNKKFPERQFFINTVIREFGVDQKQAPQFVELFTANMKFVGLIKETPGGDWLAAEASATTVTAMQVDEAESEAQEDEQNGPELEVPPPTPPAKKMRPNRIFIGHGKNSKPLDQLTKTLDTMGIPYAVAEDEPNAGRPISQKVRETMEQCGAAILIFSADVEYFDKEGAPVWRPSENVSHELGAASVMYDDRIIVFKEDLVRLASNYSGIGYIAFEKDKLDAKTNELLRELVAFKILKLSLNDDEQ